MKINLLITFLLVSPTFLQAVSLNPLNALCWGGGWPITECQVTTIDENGETNTGSFIPEKDRKLTVGTCYKFGCHPMYCSDWRSELRQECKKEYDRIKKLSQFMRGQKKIVSESFEGCAQERSATGVLALLDFIGRKTMPESWYFVCTKDSPQTEYKLISWAKEYAPAIGKWFKETISSGLSKTGQLTQSGFQAAKQYLADHGTSLPPSEIK